MPGRHCEPVIKFTKSREMPRRFFFSFILIWWRFYPLAPDEREWLQAHNIKVVEVDWAMPPNTSEKVGGCGPKDLIRVHAFNLTASIDHHPTTPPSPLPLHREKGVTSVHLCVLEGPVPGSIKHVKRIVRPLA